MLVAKTMLSIFKGEFMATVKSLHPYEVPEIIASPIVSGSSAYLEWIGSVTKGWLACARPPRPVLRQRFWQVSRRRLRRALPVGVSVKHQ